ncbi:MAG: homoserine kinase [Gammaproteobacteria bacterium]
MAHFAKKMAVFTYITPDEAARWTRLHFGVAADSAAPIAEGIENTNYLLSAAGRRYILTIFEKWDFAMADFYAALMRHFAADGAPVPSPLVPRTPAGTRWNDKPCLLTPFVEGAWLSAPGAAECQKMGAAAAKLHISAAHFTRRMPNPRGAEWRRQTAEKLHAEISVEARKTLRAALAEDAEFSALPLPSAACHCDLFRNNVLWRGGEIAGIIDFYFGGEDALIFDLAVCACDWCFARGQNEFDRARLAALLEGYESLRPLCDLERALFHRALQSAALRFWISRLYDWHFPRNAEILTPHDPRQFENIFTAAQKTRRAFSAGAGQ